MDATNPKKPSPDTVIKVFENQPHAEGKSNQLKELLQFITKSKNHGTVLKLAECLEGDIYDLTYSYITLRRVEESDKKLENFRDDGDPMSDYFSTLWRLKYVNPEKITSNADNHWELSKSGKPNRNKRFILLAFKVLDDDRTAKLDKTWKDWTGAKELSCTLSHAFDIVGVSCLKGVNVVPDVFKYFVFIELHKIECLSKKYEDILLMNCLQRFRINRMFGYCAIYTESNMTDLMNDLDSIDLQ